MMLTTVTMAMAAAASTRAAAPYFMRLFLFIGAFCSSIVLYIAEQPYPCQQTAGGDKAVEHDIGFVPGLGRLALAGWGVALGLRLGDALGSISSVTV